MTEASRLKATIYVGGLDFMVNERTLTDAFLPFGDIVEVSIPKPEAPSSADPHRGFGYVEFESQIDATEAIDNMDQSELFGRVLKVAQAKPQKEGNEGLSSRIAIWEQEGWLAKQAAGNDMNEGGNAHGQRNSQQDTSKNFGADFNVSDIAGPQLAQTPSSSHPRVLPHES